MPWKCLFKKCSQRAIRFHYIFNECIKKFLISWNGFATQSKLEKTKMRFCLLCMSQKRKNRRKSPQLYINYSSPADLRHNISALISRAINAEPRRLSGAYLRRRVLDTLWLCSDVDWMAMVAPWGWELEVLIAVVMGSLLMILCLCHCKVYLRYVSIYTNLN